tara:strand:+ start:519 stop:1073 length:555 start_codon:yes stop_codon:yes gene_type:complete
MKQFSISMSGKNRIKDLRTYLCGPMDRVADGGVAWRAYLSNYLKARDVIVLDPCNKPTDMGVEDLENRALRREWKKNGEYQKVADSMRVIRNTDLRMVDVSDFIIANLDLEAQPCGTYEELFLANRQKKPILVRVAQGKENTPDWLLGTLPHETIFSTWDEMKDYLEYVSTSNDMIDRWVFFNF